MSDKISLNQNLSSKPKPSVLWLLIAVLALGASFSIGRTFSRSIAQPPHKLLNELINQDLSTLAKAQPQIRLIRSIDLSSEGTAFKPWVDSLKFQLPLTQSANHELQIFIYFFFDNDELGANVQYDLLNASTKNTEWEITRTYKLGKIR